MSRDGLTDDRAQLDPPNWWLIIGFVIATIVSYFLATSGWLV